MKKITVILIVVALMYRVVTMAQVIQMPELNESWVKPLMDKSTTVIEGRIIDNKIFYKKTKGKDDDEVGEAYALLLIKPTSFLKGVVDSSITYEVSILVGFYTKENGQYNMLHLSEQGSFTRNGIYFFSDEIKPPDYCQPFSNATHVNCLLDINYIMFNSVEVLKFFDEKFNLKPKSLEQGMLEKKSPNENKITPIKPKINPVNSNHTSTNKNNGHSKHITDVGLSLAMANQYMSGSNLEFDILIAADDVGKYLDNCVMDILFSNTIGNFLAGSINISTDAYFFDPSMILYPFFDYNSNIVHVQFGADSSLLTGWHRAEIPTTFENFLHVSVPVADCYSEIFSSFTNLSFVGLSSFFTDLPDADILSAIQFNTTTYSGHIDSVYCHHLPTITGFSPATIYPGDYYPGNPVNKEQLTINGNYFGLQKGKVFMKNADNGGLDSIQLNDRDILLWSDNSIIVNVPSWVDSTIYASSNGFPCIGSGTFSIKTDSGEIASSYPLEVYCPYGIHDRIDPGPNNPKRRVNIANENHIGSITFRLDTSITNYPDPNLIPSIRLAIQEWDCAININFLLDTIPIADNGFNGDGISTIFLVNSYPVNIIQATYVYPTICTNPSGSERYIVASNIKIGILRNPATASSWLLGYTWQCDTSISTHSIGWHKLDFHGAILHELGHACLLEHVNQSNNLMFWAPGNLVGPVDPWNRMKIYEPDNIDGGDDVVMRSASIIYLPLCSGPLIPGTLFCTFENHIKEINQNVSSIKIYPNPVNDNQLNVAYQLKQDAPVSFIILDNLGKEVLRFAENKSAGDHVEQLNLNNISAGVYYLEVIINGIGDSGEIVKTR